MGTGVIRRRVTGDSNKRDDWKVGELWGEVETLYIRNPQESIRVTTAKTPGYRGYVA